MLKEISLYLFNNEELLGMLITCLLAWSIITALFYQLKKRKKEEPKKNWTLNDAYLICIITVIYSIFSLWNLGSFKAPQNFWQPQVENETILLTLPEKTQFDTITWISGEGDSNLHPTGLQFGTEIQIDGSNDQQQWEPILKLENSSYMAWVMSTVHSCDYRYIRLTFTKDHSVLHEIGFRQSNEEQHLPVQFVSQSNLNNPFNGEALIDEQNTLPLKASYINGTYFDEIYHTRNAYEIANGLIMYSHVHPLFGTSFIALAIKVFGLNPFGWRIAGALFGILMLPLFYLLGKLLFKQTRYAAIGTILFAADFMHYTTSRIGTLEPFSIFWILLMTTLMIYYVQLDFFKEKLTKTLGVLATCGITMGLAIATKWTGAYAAVALAILFFNKMFNNFNLYRSAVTVENKKEEDHQIIQQFTRRTAITLFWCCLFFVAVPLIIYFVAYMPMMIFKNTPWSIQGVIDHTIGVYNYHATLTATHPFQSVWWQWVLNLKPIWYYFSSTETTVSTISAFGNPLLWWAGAGSIIYCFIALIRKRCSNAWIISVCFLCQIIPWVLVTRCVFIYHYYPSVPFMILSVVYCIAKIEAIQPLYRRHVHIFVFLCVLCFILFLPVIGGFNTTHFYIDNILRWLPSWYFG